MALNRAALLQQIAESNASGGGNYMRDSRGRLCVKKFSLEDGFNGNRCVIEFVVVSSAKVNVVTLTDQCVNCEVGTPKGTRIDVEPYAVGDAVSEVYMLGDPKKDPGFGKTKKFVCALYGVAPTAVTPDELVGTMDELDKTNAARGMVIDYDTRRHETKENKKEIVITEFTTVPGTGPDNAQTPEQIKAMCEWMDSLRAVPQTQQSQPAATA